MFCCVVCLMLNTTCQFYLSIYTAYHLYSVLTFCLSISYLLASFLPCIFNLLIASPCGIISAAWFAWCLTLPVSVACLFTLPTSVWTASPYAWVALHFVYLHLSDVFTAWLAHITQYVIFKNSYWFRCSQRSGYFM